VKCVEISGLWRI